MKFLAPHIKEIFNKFNQGSFPGEWTPSVAIPLHKTGNINNPSNYLTIMIDLLLGKLFASMLENIINMWDEKEGKIAKGKAGFRPKNSTIDHCITLRHLIQKFWDKKVQESFCCFADFKKAFDTVPRDKLWHRMEEQGAPTEYIPDVLKLYEHVRA